MTDPADTEVTLLTIEVVSYLSRVPVRCIRRYETEGLIQAEQIHALEGRRERLYSVSTVHLVRRIHSYERVGVNLAGIEIILRLLEQLAHERYGS